MDTIWHEIVEAALREGVKISGGRAISGARLRQLIVQHAKNKQLEFPTPEYSSFSKFVEAFSSLMLMQRRAGRDFLVAPADMPELLTAGIVDSGVNRIREDIFRALTQINKSNTGAQYYLPSSDEIVWIENDQPKPLGAVPFPKASLDQEILDRRAFIDSLPSPLSQDTKTLLLVALDSPSPLGSFTSVVRDQGLHHVWHRYRMAAVLQRLRAWCKQNDTPWSETWIDEVKPLPHDVLSLITTDSANQEAGFLGSEFLMLLANVATNDDLARIKVPLDLVMKVWQAKHR